MGTITILGTGWTEGQLTLEAVALLKGGGRIVLHTDHCGCAKWLRGQEIPFESLDDIYEACEDFDEHIRLSVKRVMAAAEDGDVLYCVGDVRDRSAVALAEAVRGSVRVVAGPPSEGPLLALAAGQTRTVEASDWENFTLSAMENCLIREIDDPRLAAEVKLRLMEIYPGESEIWLLNGDSEPVSIPLYALDRARRYDHRTCALVPAQRDIMKLERYDFDQLCAIMRRLCAPDGCPWDRVQTHESLRACIVEEAYEVVDAIDDQDPDHLCEELGDMLMQIALHAEIARRHGEFDTGDITTAICEKMIRRHTHVFGVDHADNAQEVLGLWTKNKMAERGQSTRTQVLRDVTKSLPATLRCLKVLKRSAEVGIGEGDAREVKERLKGAISDLDGEKDEAAFGRVLMALMDVARLEGVDPELALNRAADRYIERFDAMEREMVKNGLTFEAANAETLRKYWDLVKL